MADTALIVCLEERLRDAWPAIETQPYGGWVLRFANGYSKRANSASPAREGADLDPADIARILGEFDRRGIRPVFRLTGLEAPGTDAALKAAGLVEIEPSLCLTAPASSSSYAGIEIERAASSRWIEAAARSYGGDKANADHLAAIVTRIRGPAAFATIRAGGEDVAWGLAVAGGGFVGLYDIVVAPAARGRGLGRRLVTALIGWGHAAGASSAYLQVREDNAVAKELYRSLGFTQAYRYTHRAAP